MKLVAITGGLGFIGTNLVPLLMQSTGASVRILDNSSNPSGEFEDRPGIELLKGDIRDADRVERLVEGADAVVHLAAHTRVIDSIEQPALNFEQNTHGTFNVLEAMRKKGVQRLINASTGGAILGEVQPPINEEMPAKPASPYGASKLAAEGYCWAYAQSYGLETASLRFSNVYGPYSRNKSSVVATFLKQIRDNSSVTVYGDGSQTRDYLYVGDLVQGVVKALKGSAVGVFQLGSGQPTSVNELILKIREITGADFTVRNEGFRAGEVIHTHCDISKARQALNFNPSVDIVRGVDLTWQWFRQSA